ncbi:MAG: glycosyltransferase family 2 protein [Prevotella sp.]|nr:glycosyltransferase family 2 protein [Prevotella sp.]
MSSYEVTIAIPVYNAERHIRETMDSIMEQTFPNIEILICDDCGYDQSIEIIHEYQHSHPRGKDIRIVRQPWNMGIGNARNRLIDEARGRYLYFMDADDTISPYTIELMVRSARECDAEFVYASYERIEVSDSGKTKSTMCCYPFLKFLNEDEFANFAYLKYDNIQAPVWNILMLVEVLRKNEIRFQPVNYWEDFAVSIDFPTYVTRVVLLPDVTYRYFCRSGSLSHFQERTVIRKEEIQQTIDLINKLKWSTERIKNESYLPLRTYKVMLTEFYIACTILHEEKKIRPAYTKREVRDIMRSPLRLPEVIRFKQALIPNLILHLFGVLPPSVSVFLIRMLGKRKGLI